MLCHKCSLRTQSYFQSSLLSTRKVASINSIGHLHDDVSLRTTRILQGFSLFRCLNLAGITKVNHERQNEKDSGSSSSKMTPVCV